MNRDRFVPKLFEASLFEAILLSSVPFICQTGPIPYLSLFAIHCSRSLEKRDGYLHFYGLLLGVVIGHVSGNLEMSLNWEKLGSVLTSSVACINFFSLVSLTIAALNHHFLFPEDRLWEVGDFPCLQKGSAKLLHKVLKLIWFSLIVIILLSLYSLISPLFFATGFS